MLNTRVGAQLAAATLRRIIFRHQARTAYDIHVIRYTYIGISMQEANEVFAMALSQRFQDQVDDSGPVGFNVLNDTLGLFAPSSFVGDLLTSGAIGLIPSDTIVFPKPFRVPYASVIFNAAVATAINAGVEIYFDRVRISNMELAQLITQAGGRTESPPS